MERISYNFEGLETAMFNLKRNPSGSVLDEIRKELNKFYKDSECEEVIYTFNTDKMFFGMSVMPIINTSEVKEILTTNKKIRINKYIVEIDSKLLELGLTKQELTAIILHEVGHMVNDAQPLETVNNTIAVNMASKGDTLKRLSDNEFKEMMVFAIKNSVQKLYSVFQIKDEEIIADQFVVACGYGQPLENAVKKIVRNTGSLSKGIGSRLVIIQWCIRVYKDLGLRRLGTIKLMNKMYKMSPSELEKRTIGRLIHVLEEPEKQQAFSEGVAFIDKMLDKASSAYKGFKYKGMRGLEDDLYEFSVRVENVDKEEDALILLRSINLRMSMIDDYVIEQNRHMAEDERERWFNLKNKYQVLRDKITKKKLYQDKYLGLFVQTPVVSSRYEA